MTVSQSAMAEIVLYDENDTTFSTDGYFNTFYVHSDVERDGEQFDRKQSRVKMGFLPNWIGFNFGKQVGDLKLGGRSSFWVTINDSDTNGTETGIDVRQFYATAANEQWGEVLFGKDFGLFGRSNILLDEMLSGYGQVSDTLGLVDGGGVSFGNIGTGYPYPFPTSQITYRSPKMNGLRIAAGIMDPVDTTEDTDSDLDKAYQEAPRFEAEVTYEFELGGTQFPPGSTACSRARTTPTAASTRLTPGPGLRCAGQDGQPVADRIGLPGRGHQPVLHQQCRRGAAA